jgi:hypothetical protein
MDAAGQTPLYLVQHSASSTHCFETTMSLLEAIGQQHAGAAVVAVDSSGATPMQLVEFKERVPPAKELLVERQHWNRFSAYTSSAGSSDLVSDSSGGHSAANSTTTAAVTAAASSTTGATTTTAGLCESTSSRSSSGNDCEIMQQQQQQHRQQPQRTRHCLRCAHELLKSSSIDSWQQCKGVLQLACCEQPIAQNSDKIKTLVHLLQRKCPALDLGRELAKVVHNAADHADDVAKLLLQCIAEAGQYNATRTYELLHAAAAGGRHGRSCPDLLLVPDKHSGNNAVNSETADGSRALHLAYKLPEHIDALVSLRARVHHMNHAGYTALVRIHY